MELVVSVILCTAPRPCGFREGWDCEAGGKGLVQMHMVMLV